MNAFELFAKHLDLGPLRGRSRGVVRCPFHGDDRRPSLSVDLDRGLFNCFACGAQGGLAAFAERVGEETPRARSGPQSHETEWQRAWRQICRRNVAEAARRAEWAPVWSCADLVRGSARAGARARRLATALGPEDPRTWPLLERAAQVERGGWLLEEALEAAAAARRPAA
jgi:hypothetical protein